MTNYRSMIDQALEAARRLGCDPAKCIVFEDAPAGVTAAHAAGALAVALPDARMPENAPKFDELQPRWRGKPRDKAATCKTFVPVAWRAMC